MPLDRDNFRNVLLDLAVGGVFQQEYQFDNPSGPTSEVISDLGVRAFDLEGTSGPSYSSPDIITTTTNIALADTNKNSYVTEQTVGNLTGGTETNVGLVQKTIPAVNHDTVLDPGDFPATNNAVILDDFCVAGVLEIITGIIRPATHRFPIIELAYYFSSGARSWLQIGWEGSTSGPSKFGMWFIGAGGVGAVEGFNTGIDFTALGATTRLAFLFENRHDGIDSDSRLTFIFDRQGGGVSSSAGLSLGVGLTPVTGIDCQEALISSIGKGADHMDAPVDFYNPEAKHESYYLFNKSEKLSTRRVQEIVAHSLLGTPRYRFDAIDNFQSALAVPLGVTDGELELAGVSSTKVRYPWDDYPLWLTLVREDTGEAEVVKATARVGNSFEVSRGQRNTKPLSFGFGDRITLSFGATDINKFLEGQDQIFFPKRSHGVNSTYYSLDLADSIPSDGTPVKFPIHHDNSVFVGNEPGAQEDNSIAVGSRNNATGVGSIAVGNDNIASGINSIAIGTDNDVQGQDSISVGNRNIIPSNTTRALAFGDDITIGANSIYALALGANTIAGGPHCIAIGEGAEAGVGGVAYCNAIGQGQKNNIGNTLASPMFFLRNFAPDSFLKNHGVNESIVMGPSLDFTQTQSELFQFPGQGIGAYFFPIAAGIIVTTTNGTAGGPGSEVTIQIGDQFDHALIVPNQQITHDLSASNRERIELPINTKRGFENIYTDVTAYAGGDPASGNLMARFYLRGFLIEL